MSGKLPNRIPEEDIDSCNTWQPPDMPLEGNRISTAERARRAIRRKAPEEVVEDVIEEVEYKPLTADELQAITDAAEQEGYAEGHNKGMQQGLTEGRKKGEEEGLAQAEKAATQQLQQQVAQLQGVMQAFMQPLQQQSQQLQQQLLAMVCELTRQVIQRELQIDSSCIVNVVKQALEALPPSTENIKIFLHPDDIQLIQDYADQRHESWQLLPDPQQSVGGCRIESPYSRVDNSVDIRLEALLTQFLSAELQKPEDNLPDFSVPEIEAESDNPSEAALETAPETAPESDADSESDNELELGDPESGEPELSESEMESDSDDNALDDKPDTNKSVVANDSQASEQENKP